MKKSLILLASMLVCPLLAGCSGGEETTTPAPTTTQTTTDTTPADPTDTLPPEQDPNEVLAGWEEAIDLTLNVDAEPFTLTEVGAKKEYKLKFVEANKDHFFKRITTGTAISAVNGFKSEVFNYKGDVITLDGQGRYYCTYAGYIYFRFSKIDAAGTNNVVSHLNFGQIDRSIEVGHEGTSFSPNIELAGYKDVFFSFTVEAGKNYGFSASVVGTIPTSYSVFHNDLSEVTVDNTSLTMYKYNFTPTISGRVLLRMYNNFSSACTVTAFTVEQIDIA